MVRVAYIDDEVGLLEITKDFLEVDGEVQVDPVSCPTEALAQIERGGYDVIVSDYQMPFMSGIDLLKALRKKGDRTPFILFTGRGREEVAIEALNNGADLYLQKGGNPQVQFGELRNAIIQLAQRKKAENLVAQGEREYRDLVEGANSIILKLDPSGNIKFMNHFGKQFFGAGPEAIGQPVFGSLIMPRHHPEHDLERYTMDFLAIGRSGDSYTFPTRSGGKEAWVSWTFRAVRDADEQVSEFLVIGNDVTALKQAEMKLQHSTAVLRATLESSDEGILVVSNEGAISEYNRKFLDLWKITAAQMEGWTVQELIELTRGQLREPDGFAVYLEHCYAFPEQDSKLLLEFRDGRVMEIYSTPERIGDKITGRYWSFKDITLQKEFETGLLERHENTRSLFVNNPAIMLLIEPDSGMVVHANKAACSFYGYGEGSFRRMRLSELSTLPSEEFDRWMLLAKCNRKNYFRASHRLADGRTRDVEMFVAPINYKGRPLLFSIVQDVSETKSTQRLLEESELRHNRVLDIISEGIVAVDENERIVYANKRASDVMRLPLDKIVGRDPHAFTSMESLAALSSNLEKRRNGEAGHAEYKMKRGDGTEFWAMVAANPVYTDGVFEGSIYAISDITERKQAEKALRESEERFRSMIDRSAHAIAIVRDSVSIYVNACCVQMLGYASADELIGRPVKELFSPEHRERVPDSGCPGGQDGRPERKKESVMLRKSGDPVPVSMFCTTMNFSDGRAAVLVMDDISGRKKAEEAFQEKDHFLDRVLSTDPTGILVYDIPSRKVVYANERVVQVTGRTLEEMGMVDAMREMVHPDDYALLASAIIKVMMGQNNEVNEAELRIKDVTDGWRWVHFYGTPFMRDGNGRVVQTITGIRDVSDRRKAEEAAEKANQKLGLLGQITRHDIQNQASIILGNIELSKRSGGCTAERMEKIERSARMINSHIRFASDYQELGTTAPQWQNVAEMVHGLDISKGIAQMDITEQVRSLRICADPMLRKVFHNLLEDSVKYAGDPTRVKIDCQLDDGRLLLSYEDNGPGIAADDKDKIFKKGYGKGTGLGLFLSREVLGITGITIAETGPPGKGARFEMLVPPGQFQFA